eukprot:10599730-Lingulodinium_polyedra.AAC.1
MVAESNGIKKRKNCDDGLPESWAESLRDTIKKAFGDLGTSEKDRGLRWALCGLVTKAMEGVPDRIVERAFGIDRRFVATVRGHRDGMEEGEDDLLMSAPERRRRKDELPTEVIALIQACWRDDNLTRASPNMKDVH